MLPLAHRVPQTRSLLYGFQPLPESRPRGFVFAAGAFVWDAEAAFVVVEDPEAELYFSLA